MSLKLHTFQFAIIISLLASRMEFSGGFSFGMRKMVHACNGRTQSERLSCVKSTVLRSNPNQNDEKFVRYPCYPFGCNLTTISDDFENYNKTVPLDFVGAGTLGDIMSTPESQKVHMIEDQKANKINGSNRNQSSNSKVTLSSEMQSLDTSLNSGLVTTTGGTLQSTFSQKMHGHISPLERIALTANGNLQRIFSSYYDAPVHVVVNKCRIKSSNTKKIEKHHNMTIPIESLPSVPVVWDRSVHLSVHGQKFCTATSEITVSSEECVELVCSGKVGIGQIFRYLDKLPTFQLLDAGRSEYGGMWREYSLSCEELTCRIREEFTSNAWQLLPLKEPT